MIAVVAYHAGVPGFSGGFVGVDVFFVISGYLIAQQLWGGDRPPALADFLIRRARRLVPALAVMLAVCLPVAWALLLPAQLKDFGQAAAAGSLFAANLLSWMEAGYFTADAAQKPLLHLWTLGVEAQFYLAAALLAALCPRRVALGLGAVVALASLIAALWASWAAPEAAFFLTPFRLWEFAMGAALALRPWRAPSAAGWSGVAMIAGAVVLFSGTTPYPGTAAMVPVLATVLVLVAPPRVLGHWLLTRLGVLSYGLYLWHLPIFVFYRLSTGTTELGAAALPLSFLALACAWISHRFVEAPMRRHAALPWLGGTVAAGLAAGVALHAAQGVPARLPDASRQVLAAVERGPMPCHDLQDSACRIGDLAAPAGIALLGDSHAAHLSRALDRALAERGLSARVFTRSWCLPIPDFGTDMPGRGRGCGAYMAASWQEVLSDPKIHTVILAGQWANGTAGARGSLAPVTFRWRSLRAQTVAENVVVFDTAMRSLADRLQASGHRVIVVPPVPEYPDAVPAALARAAWSGDGSGRAAPIDYAARNGAALRILDHLLRHETSAQIEAFALLCPGGPPCPVMNADKVPLYRDASHLSTAGAALLVPYILDLTPL